jgi:hypothetical protein
MFAFTGPPQPVEIQHRGVWYRGELLGWRNEPDGRCLARVRCVVGKLRHNAWVNLADLRLPDPDAPPVENPPIDLGPELPAAASRPEAPAALPLDRDDDTRPHELLPGRARRRPPVPGATTRTLPPPKGYHLQPERQERFSHA